MNKVYFISGIDTGVGKTIATGLMARYLASRQVKVITCKVVQTGNHDFSEDRDVHRQMLGNISYPEDKIGLTAPQIFKFPSSPLLAAKLENRIVDVESIAQSVQTLSTRYDVVLAEGAGGLAVPLTEEMLSIDLATRENWPVILVSSGKLGSVNHTILSLEAIKARNITLAAVLYNFDSHADKLIDADSFEYITKYLAKNGFNAPLIRIPQVDISNPKDIDFQPLFGV